MDLNDVLRYNSSYESARIEVKNILLSILEAGEITQSDNDSLEKVMDSYNENYNVIKSLGVQIKDEQQQNRLDELDRTKLPSNPQAIIDVLTQGGRDSSVGIDSEGRLIIDDKAVPKLKLVELDVEKLYADYAEIGELVAQKATIKDLEATNAKIENLKADIGDFQDLTAVKADIKNLQAEDAKINNALINKAEVSELNAAVGNITALQTRVGKIDTLIGGNLTMDNIASLILTSEKVTVENGFIKNAMIDNVAANKITSGQINTNLVTLSSSDGSMTLNGSLQQFKDKNGKVRLQLGKDASGNFTFALFDETGTGQLITSNGITANAIGDGIIVNDMVADNANISGSKLDINSVISEVNGSTSTIKASIIKFDDKNQTLDVAFNSMSTTVQNNTSQINTNTTNISSAQGQIQTLISNTTVTEDGKNKTIKEAYSSLKQTVNSLSSTMSNTTTTIETMKNNVDATVKSVKPQYYLSTSKTELVGGSWSYTSPTWTQGKYLWQRFVYTFTNGSSKFGEASCLAGAKGDTGATGQQGPQGPQGEKGETGKNGATGRGITSITEYYLASPNNSDITTSTSGWSTSIPTINATNKYLWNYEIIKYSDNTNDIKTPKIIGAYGDKGQTGGTGAKGVGIKTITNYYLATNSSSGVTTSTSGWTTTVQSVTSTKKYLWNYEVVTFTDNTTTSTDPMIIGAYGDKGATGSQGPQGLQGEQGPQGVKGDTGPAGQSVTSVTPQFQKHTSNTTAPTGTWSDTCPAYESGKYLWVRNKVVFTNPAATKYTNAYYDPSWEAKNKADTAVTTVNNKTSKFQQTLDGFSTRVGNTEAKVNNMKTSPRNLLLGTDKPKAVSGNNTSNQCITLYKFNGGNNHGLKQSTIAISFKYEVSEGATGTFFIQTNGEYNESLGETSGWWAGLVPNTDVANNPNGQLTNVITMDCPNTKGFNGVQLRVDNFNGSITISEMIVVESTIPVNDWSLAPEDINSLIDNASQMTVDGQLVYIKDQVAQTTIDVNAITNKVGAMEANFAADGTITNLVQQVSQLQQTASQFTMEFFNKVNNADQGVNTILDYITFDANGITIGQEAYPVRLRLAKDRVVFLDVNNVELAYFRDDKLYVNNAEILDTIKIANYGFMPTANGSLTIGALS